ncbi:MAG: hypothetical protein JJE04_22865, partial [Acidobacteriia bacterium]|nr:hypothetical protein [Terriglobia bacterium]
MVRTSMKLAGASMLALSICSSAAVIPVDLKGVRTGPVKVQATPDALLITWPDETGRECGAEFSLDTSKPLITALRVAGKKIVEGARPLYWASTGKRRGGWDQFFDFPPSHPDGTRRFQSNLQMRTAKVTQHGDRVEVHFDGLTIGPFMGGVSYTFFPGSRLIQQEAGVATSEPDTAYYYDAGIQFASESDRRAGNNMDSLVSFFDTEGRLQTVQATGPERQPHSVRYRTAAARTTQG